MCIHVSARLDLSSFCLQSVGCNALYLHAVSASAGVFSLGALRCRFAVWKLHHMLRCASTVISSTKNTAAACWKAENAFLSRQVKFPVCVYVKRVSSARISLSFYSICWEVVYLQAASASAGIFLWGAWAAGSFVRESTDVTCWCDTCRMLPRCDISRSVAL